MARHTPGNFVPLDVNYPRDRAIRGAGEAAELLFVRGLAYAKGARSKGFIPDYDLEVVAVGLKGVQRRVAALVREGLWVAVDGGWRIRSWDPWNETDDTRAGSQSEAGKRGNHERWHVARSTIDPDCDLCQESPPDIATRSLPDSPPDIAPESGTESQGKGREGKGSNSSPSADADEGEPDPFDEFWKYYPRKVEKQDARKAWRAALKKTTASELIDAVKAYPFGDDPQYVKHAATWLNKGCWADTPENVRPPSLASVPNIHRDVPPWEDFGGIPNIHRDIPPWECQ